MIAITNKMKKLIETTFPTIRQLASDRFCNFPFPTCYAFPPFSLIGATLENPEGAINWDHDCSLVGSPVLVPTDAATPKRLFDSATTGKKIH